MRPLLTTGLLATGLIAAMLLPAAPTHAAGETCQGRPATIVGSGGFVRGSDGPDVVVTNGVPSVSTLGGDDLVCVTGGVVAGQTTSVETGDGDDVVDAGTAAGPTYAQLGAGSDTYTGSVHLDDVDGGDLDDRAVYVDAEPDSIATGSGADHVLSGSDGVALNGDVVVVGDNQGDVTWYGAMTGGARLVGGGSSLLAVHPGSGRAAIDASAGTLAEDGVRTLTWTGFDRYYVGPAAGGPPESLTFSGSGRDEELELRVGGRHHVDLASGDDRLLIRYAEAVGRAGSTYAGGSGRDDVALRAGRFLALDLASGRMTTTRDGRARSALTEFEQPYVAAERLTLEGTRRDDDLVFQACTATVRGRAGADVIFQNRHGTTFPDKLRCDRRSFRLYGGGGRDVLRGGAGRDLLVGGPDRDIVSGDAGRDTCSGEKLRSCEIRKR